MPIGPGPGPGPVQVAGLYAPLQQQFQGPQTTPQAPLYGLSSRDEAQTGSAVYYHCAALIVAVVASVIPHPRVFAAALDEDAIQPVVHRSAIPTTPTLRTLVARPLDEDVQQPQFTRSLIQPVPSSPVGYTVTALAPGEEAPLQAVVSHTLIQGFVPPVGRTLTALAPAEEVPIRAVLTKSAIPTTPTLRTVIALAPTEDSPIAPVVSHTLIQQFVAPIGRTLTVLAPPDEAPLPVFKTAQITAAPAVSAPIGRTLFAATPDGDPLPPIVKNSPFTVGVVTSVPPRPTIFASTPDVEQPAPIIRHTLIQQFISPLLRTTIVLAPETEAPLPVVRGSLIPTTPTLHTLVTLAPAEDAPVAPVVIRSLVPAPISSPNLRTIVVGQQDDLTPQQAVFSRFPPPSVAPSPVPGHYFTVLAPAEEAPIAAKLTNGALIPSVAPAPAPKPKGYADTWGSLVKRRNHEMMLLVVAAITSGAMDDE